MATELGTSMVLTCTVTIWRYETLSSFLQDSEQMMSLFYVRNIGKAPMSRFS